MHAELLQSCLTPCDTMDCMQPTRILCSWDSPGKNTGVRCHALLQGIFLTEGSNSGLPHSRRILYQLSVCVLSRFSCVRHCEIPWTIAHQAPLSVGFSRQEYWSALPCPSPGNIPHPGIESVSHSLLHLALMPPGKPI